MSEELEQLKDDLANWKATLGIIESRIAKLEAEQDDPWREAKEPLANAQLYGCGLNVSQTEKAIEYVRYLEAERDRLAARVAELERHVATAVPDDPTLDPARVLATAEELMWGPTVYAVMLKPKDSKPYRLKGASE